MSLESFSQASSQYVLLAIGESACFWFITSRRKLLCKSSLVVPHIVNAGCSFITGTIGFLGTETATFLGVAVGCFTPSLSETFHTLLSASFQ